MQITRTMSISEVQQMMGDATRDEATVMIEFLLVGDYTDTDQISEREWLEMCDYAAEAVAARSAD